MYCSVLASSTGFFGSLWRPPLLGAVTGLAVFILVAADVIGPLLLGAIIGGVMA